MAKPSVTCPGCKKQLVGPDNPSWPFCSERCKKQDLGDWASEKFKINARGDKEDESDEFGEGSED